MRLDVINDNKCSRLHKDAVTIGQATSYLAMFNHNLTTLLDALEKE